MHPSQPCKWPIGVWREYSGIHIMYVGCPPAYGGRIQAFISYTQAAHQCMDGVFRCAQAAHQHTEVVFRCLYHAHERPTSVWRAYSSVHLMYEGGPPAYGGCIQVYMSGAPAYGGRIQAYISCKQAAHERVPSVNAGDALAKRFALSQAGLQWPLLMGRFL